MNEEKPDWQADLNFEHLAECIENQLFSWETEWRVQLQHRTIFCCQGSIDQVHNNSTWKPWPNAKTAVIWVRSTPGFGGVLRQELLGDEYVDAMVRAESPVIGLITDEAQNDLTCHVVSAIIGYIESQRQTSNGTHVSNGTGSQIACKAAVRLRGQDLQILFYASCRRPLANPANRSRAWLFTPQRAL